MDAATGNELSECCAKPLTQAADLVDAAARAMSVSALIDASPDPDVALVESDPDRLLAYLFVAPRACPALDRLLELRAGPSPGAD